MVDRLARDGLALLKLLEGRQLTATMAEAAELVALVIGQDLEQDETGTYRIVRGVAKDRIISTVDTDARHGHNPPHAVSTATRGMSPPTQIRR